MLMLEGHGVCSKTHRPTVKRYRMMPFAVHDKTIVDPARHCLYEFPAILLRAGLVAMPAMCPVCCAAA